MKAFYVVTLELESITDRPDLLAALLENVLVEGFAQYLQLGELEPFETLALLASPPQAFDEQALRLRRMRQDRLKLAHTILEKRLAYRADTDAATQATLPGM